MPLYEFSCNDCGKKVETYSHKAISDGEIGRCDCGGFLRREFAKANVNLKGRGKSAQALLGRTRKRDMDLGPIMTALAERTKQLKQAGLIVLMFCLLATGISAQGPVGRSLSYLRGALRAQLRAKTGSDLLTNSAIDFAINRAISRVCAQYPAIEKIDTVVINQDSEGGALNTDFDRAKAVYRMSGDTIRLALTCLMPDSIAAVLGSRTESSEADRSSLSRSRYFYTTGRRLMVLPKPSRPAADPDSFLVEYYAQDEMLSDTTDSTAIVYGYIDKVIHFAAVLLSGTRANYADGYFYWSLFRDEFSAYKALQEMQLGGKL